MTNLLLYNLFNGFVKRNLVRKVSTVNFPKRVKRDNLTILKELASTVKTTPGAPNYEYIDDPNLLPITSIDKKISSLSTQSGRNAAYYILETYPKLFSHDSSFPIIKDYSPPAEKVLSEEPVQKLQDLVELLEPLKAYAAYKEAIDQGKEIPRALLDDLFDLLCYTNGKVRVKQPPPSTRFHLDGVKIQEEEKDEEEEKKSVWLEEGPAESIFKSLEKPSSRNIGSLIKGRSKFKAHELALQEYKKVIENKTRVEASAHNAILSSYSNVKQDYEESLAFILDVFRLMQETQVRPTIDTFNNTLSILTHPYSPNTDLIPPFEIQRNFLKALEVIGELFSCDLEPTLTTWWYVLEISYPTYKARGTILENIIAYLASKEVTLHQATDFNFFDSAMSKCKSNARRLDVTKRLYSLVNDRSWEHMIGHINNTTSYYSSYLIMLLKYDSFDNFLQAYNSLVPNSYVPTFKVITHLFSAIEKHYAYEHVLRFWTDMQTFRYSRRLGMLTPLLSLLAGAPLDPKWQKEHVQVADSIFGIFLNDSAGFHGPIILNLTGGNISDLMTIHMNAQLHDKAWYVFSKFVSIAKTGSGLIRQEPLTTLCEHYMKENDFEKTHAILKVMWEYGLSSTHDLVQTACADMSISDVQKIQLKNFLV